MPAKKKPEKQAARSPAAKPRSGGKRRTALAIRDAITSALSQDKELMEEITDEHAAVPADASKLLRAVDAIEPILADAVNRRPSFLGRLAYGTAQLIGTLASEDDVSTRRLAEIAGGSHVGIVFLDVVGFTEYTASNGDEAAVGLVRRVEKLVRNVCRRFEGEVVKHLGDGFLLAFGSSSRAVRAALALRDAAREERSRDASFQKVRIAVHAGRPSVVRDDLIGHDVNLTARLLAYCEPGEVLISEETKRLAERRLKTARFFDAGRVKVRGVPQPVATYRVEAAPKTR